ncbi:MAG: inositol monophosphatase family protein [Rubrivivax sp.]
MPAPTDQQLDEWLRFAHELADAAHALLAPAAAMRPDVQVKADRSFVTALDAGIEARLRELIGARYRPRHPRRGSRRRTRSTPKRCGSSTPSTAPHPSSPACRCSARSSRWPGRACRCSGVMHLPVTNQRYVGIAGRASTLNGQPIRTRPCAELRTAILSTSNPDIMSDAERTALQALCERTAWRIYGGCCMSYGLLAAGRTDLAIDGGLKLFDYAPFRPLIEGAGGVITDWQGRAVTLQCGSRVLAAGDAARHREALACIEQALESMTAMTPKRDDGDNAQRATGIDTRASTSKASPSATAAAAVIEGLALDIEAGSFFTLLGPSGCGKTTLLRTIAGFVPARAGSIRFGERDVTAVPPHRRDIGMVFQDYALFPDKTVFDNVAYGLRARGRDAASVQRQVGVALERVGCRPSGSGIRRRSRAGSGSAWLWRGALVIEPQVLLMDEPLSNLDAKLRMQVQQTIAELQAEAGITTVFVTHDQDEALALSHRIGVMNHGRLEQVGTPAEIYRRPASGYVADFVGAANLLPVTLAEGVAAGGTATVRLSGMSVRAVAPAALNAGAALLMARPESLVLAPAATPSNDRQRQSDRPHTAPPVPRREDELPRCARRWRAAPGRLPRPGARRAPRRRRRRARLRPGGNAGAGAMNPFAALQGIHRPARIRPALAVAVADARRAGAARRLPARAARQRARRQLRRPRRRLGLVDGGR